jgi:hypothetical protein
MSSESNFLVIFSFSSIWLSYPWLEFYAFDFREIEKGVASATGACPRELDLSKWQGNCSLIITKLILGKTRQAIGNSKIVLSTYHAKK